MGFRIDLQRRREVLSHVKCRRLSRVPRLRQSKKVIAQSALLTPRNDRLTNALPPRGSKDALRLAEGSALPYEGARHCPGFSRRRREVLGNV